MNLNRFFLPAASLILSLSCEQSSPPGPQTSPATKSADSTSATSLPKDGDDGTDALPCNWKVTGPAYLIHHYEPKPGKVVGFWPGAETPDWAYMRTKYGFPGILIAGEPEYYQAINAGYNPDYMMVSVGPSNWMEVIDGFPAKRYYSGEPTEHRGFPDCTSIWIHPQWQNNLYLLEIIRGYAQGVRQAEYVIDGFKRCPHLIEGVIDVDRVMFSSYRHWYWTVFPECWEFTSPPSDQRSDWTEMKGLFGAKFTSTWIGAHDDSHDGDAGTEIGDLVGHAANLGLTEIWLYCGSGVAPGGRIESFAYEAWENGYLRRFDQLCFAWWRCDEPNPCANCDPESMEGWVLDHYECDPNLVERFIP